MIGQSSFVASSVMSLESLEIRVLMHHAGISWGAIPTLIGQNWAAGAYPRTDGRGESIAVIDTGIDYMHPDLGGGFGRHFKVVGGWNFIDNNSNIMDTNGHGTAVAGLLAGYAHTFNGQIYQGIAPGASLIGLKVDDGVNEPPPDRIAAALQWVLNNRAHYNIVAVNLSEGDGTYNTDKFFGPDYGGLLSELRAAGVLVAVASGNSGWTNAVEYPAADVSAVAVGSTNVNDNISSFTSRGPALDMLAPGENVLAPTLDGNGQPTYAFVSGTSFSTPMIAGAAALLKELRPWLSVDQQLNIMQSTGTGIYDSGSGLSFSRLNLYAAIRSIARAPRGHVAHMGRVLAATAKPLFSSTPINAGNA